MIISRFIDSDGVRIHYLDSVVKGRGAPIVFIPGLTDVADDYTEVLPMFDRRIVVLELRGRGRSGAPADGYDLAALRADVSAVVDALTDGPIHLMTFSRGTSYAIAWTLEHPDRVLSLSIGDYIPEERVVPSERSRIVLDGRWRGTPVRERINTEAALKMYAAARTRSFWEPLSMLGIPLLVVRSGNSVLVTDDDWARYRRLFPDADLIEFPDSPHDIFRPDRGRYPGLVREHVEPVERDR